MAICQDYAGAPFVVYPEPQCKSATEATAAEAVVGTDQNFGAESSREDSKFRCTVVRGAFSRLVIFEANAICDLWCNEDESCTAWSCR